jgi:hypothetical protein
LTILFLTQDTNTIASASRYRRWENGVGVNLVNHLWPKRA